MGTELILRIGIRPIPEKKNWKDTGYWREKNKECESNESDSVTSENYLNFWQLKMFIYEKNRVVFFFRIDCV